MQQAIIHIILVGLMFAAVFIGTSQKSEERSLKQQIIEKQTTLLIDAARPGMEFHIQRFHLYSTIDFLQLKNGRIFAGVDGLPLGKGYPYFTPYNVELESTETAFIIKITERNS